MPPHRPRTKRATVLSSARVTVLSFGVRRMFRRRVINEPCVVFPVEEILKLDKGTDGVDQFEFIVGMLNLMGVRFCGDELRMEDVKTFFLAFDELDEDKNGFLHEAELRKYHGFKMAHNFEVVGGRASLREAEPGQS